MMFQRSVDATVKYKEESAQVELSGAGMFGRTILDCFQDSVGKAGCFC